MFAKIFSPDRKSSLTTRQEHRRPHRSQIECLKEHEILTASPLEISRWQLAAVSGEAGTHHRTLQAIDQVMAAADNWAAS
jgi:hypothetical protein